MMNTSTASTNSGCRRQGFKVVMIFSLMFALASIGPIGPQAVMAQDPDNSAWQQLPDMAQRRWEPGTVVLDDLLYVFGGYTNRPEPGPKSIKHVDVFDPKDNSWRQLADLPSAITHFNAVLDGRTVWFAGGFKDGYKGHAIAEVWNYDIDKNTYTAAPSLPEPRAAGGLALVGRKLHYISGLMPDRDTDAPDHWVLDLEDTSKGWNSAAKMPAPRNQFGTITVNGAKGTGSGPVFGSFTGTAFPLIFFSNLPVTISFVANFGAGSGNLIVHLSTFAPPNTYIFPFTLGNEVRTFIPEPSTAPLSGLGLLALSGYAARRRARRHTRRT